MFSTERKTNQTKMNSTLSAEILDYTISDVTDLDSLLLGPGGHIKLLPALYYRSINRTHLRIWCHLRARYSIPTLELIEWLKPQIAGKETIEIGAGCGDLGYHLGIKMTDSYQQVDDPIITSYFKLMGQPAVHPFPEVIKMNAEVAVRKYKPKIVIASWVTERWVPEINQELSTLNGVDEAAVIASCDKYIFVGNEAIHGKKRVLSLPHKTYKTHQIPGLVSRAKDPRQDLIYVWEHKH